MSHQKMNVVARNLQGLSILKKGFESRESIKGDGLVEDKLWYVNTNASDNNIPAIQMNVNTGEVTDITTNNEKILIKLPNSQFTRWLIKEGWSFPSALIPVTKEITEVCETLIVQSIDDFFAQNSQIVSALSYDCKKEIEQYVKDNNLHLIPPSNSLIKKGILLVSPDGDCAEYLSMFSPKEMSIFMQPSMKSSNPFSIKVKVIDDCPEGNGAGFLCSKDWCKLQKAFKLADWIKVLKVAGQDDSYFIKAQLIEKPELEESEICIGNFKSSGLKVGDIVTLDDNSIGLHQTEIPSCKLGSNISTQELKFLDLHESRPYDVIRKEIIEVLQEFVNGNHEVVGEILNMVDDKDSEILHQLNKYWRVGVEVDHPVYNNALRRMAANLFKTKVLKLYSHESIRSKGLINPTLNPGECLVPAYTFKREIIEVSATEKKSIMHIKPQLIINIGDELGISRMPVLDRSGIKAMKVVGYSSKNCIEISAEDMQDMQGDADGDDLRADKNLLGSSSPFPFTFLKEKKEETDLLTTCCDIKYAADKIGAVATIGTKELLAHDFTGKDNLALQEQLAFLYQAFVGGLKWKLPTNVEDILGETYPEDINLLILLASKRDMPLEERVEHAKKFAEMHEQYVNPLEMIAIQLQNFTFPESNAKKYSALLAEIQVETFGFEQNLAIKNATQDIFSANLEITNCWNKNIVERLKNKEKPDMKIFNEILPSLKFNDPAFRAKQVSMLAKLVSKRKMPSLFDASATINEMQIVYGTLEK